MKTNRIGCVSFALGAIAPFLCASAATAATWSVSAFSSPFSAQTVIEGTFDLSDSQVFSNLDLRAIVGSSINETLRLTTLDSPPFVNSNETFFVATAPRADLGLTFNPSLNNQTGRSEVFFSLTMLSDLGTTAFQSGGTGMSQIVDRPAQSTLEPSTIFGFVTAVGLLVRMRK
jgi:hypothetical protein